MLPTEPLRVLLLAGPEFPLQQLPGVHPEGPAAGTSGMPEWEATRQPGGLAQRLVSAITAHAKVPALVCQLASTGQRALLVAKLAPQGASSQAVVAAATCADLVILVCRQGHPLEVAQRHALELALLAGITRAVVLGWRSASDPGGPLQGPDWAAHCQGIRHDPGYQGLSCVACDDGPDRALAGLLDAAPSRRLGRESAVLRLAGLPSSKRLAGGVDELTVRVLSGTLRSGQALRLCPGGETSEVTRLAQAGAAVDAASAGQIVDLGLARPVPSPVAGVLVADAQAPAEVADAFEAGCLWLAPAPLLPGRGYLLDFGSHRVHATLTRLKYRQDADTAARVAATQLQAGEVGVCAIETARPIAFDPFLACAETGGALVCHPETGEVLGAMLLHFSLRRAQNVHWQAIEVDKAAHARLKDQSPCIVWLTGLSGAGKSTIANLLQKQLYVLGHHSYLLDGDNVRHGLNKDLGFTAADRVENIRRVGEVARLMVDAGLIVITAFISPFRDERRMVRSLVGAGEFIEVFVDAPLSLAEQRDPKGLYKKARSGALKNFTGIDSPYEAPEHAELRIDTGACTAAAAAAAILDYLAARDMVRREL